MGLRFAFVVCAVVCLSAGNAAASEPVQEQAFDGLSTLWVLLAAFLVFFMQAGFGMLEAGLIRAKNAGNVLMKNLLDFCFAAGGGVDLEQRCLDWFFKTWLPASRYVPDEQPCFEAWIGRPLAHGMEYCELHAQLPACRTAGRASGSLRYSSRSNPFEPWRCRHA